MVAQAPLRVFLGTDDLAFCLSGLAEGFRRRGHEVTTMVEARSRYATSERYDHVRGRELARFIDVSKGGIVAGLARRLDASVVSRGLGAWHTRSYLHHDLFIFFGRAWLPERILLPTLRRLGKKVAFYLLGSEARHISAFAQEFRVDTSSWRQDLHLDPLDPKVCWLRTLELGCNAIYSVPDQAGLQIRPYYHAHLPLHLPSGLAREPRGRAIPRIVHAPSRDDIKGTSFVKAAMEALRAEGLAFEFRILTGVPRVQVLEALADADLLVDELWLHGPGVLAGEAMALGCAVATRTLGRDLAVFDPPVAPVTIESLVPQLRRLITLREHRFDLATRGRAWALREQAPEHVAGRVEQHLLTGTTPDYTPDFFLENYLPTSPLSPRARRLGTRVLRQFRPDAGAIVRRARERGVVA